MQKIRRINIVPICLIAFVVGIFLCSITFFAPLSASAESLHSHVEDDYCLVCDIASKINALPDAEDISVDNLAEVIQGINDIDRIKFDLTDEQFEELVTLVETHDNGVDSHVITKYDNALNKARELSNNGVNLAVSKKFDLGEESLSDTSETEVSFELINVDSGVSTTLKLYDLDAGTSALGAEFYTLTSSGWCFGYVVPEGNYVIKETNLDKPITVNGKQSYFHCAQVSDGENIVMGNQMSLSVGSEPITLAFSNVKCDNLNGVVSEQEGASSITFDCGVCGEGSATYTLRAPSGCVYDGSTTHTAVVERTAFAETHFASVDDEIISYEYKHYHDDEWQAISESETYKSGYYRATMSVGGASSSVEYAVSYEPAEIMFIATPGTMTYGSISGAITVIVKSEAGMRYEYQWYNDLGEELEGEVASSYTIPGDIHAGTYGYYVEVRAFDASDSSVEPLYTSTYSELQYVKVEQRMAIVKIEDASGEYGEELPSFSYVCNGIAITDSPEEVFTIECTADKFSGVGFYNINGTTINNDYQITYLEGEFEMLPRALDIEIQDMSSAYGEDIKEIDYEISNGSLAEGDDAENVFQIYTTADSYAPGTYNIELSLLDTNYVIGYTLDASYVVETEKVTVTFGSVRELVYNGGNQHPDYECSDPDAVPVISCGANVGTHTAVVTGFTSDAYELVGPTSVEYVITPTPITIKADDISKQIGETDPKLTFTITGIVYGNYGFRDITLVREEGEEVGEYHITITVDEGQNKNYDITLVDGTFRIFNSIEGISNDLEKLKNDLKTALDKKADLSEIESKLEALEKAIKDAEDACKYAEADSALKEQLISDIEKGKEEVLDAVKELARTEAEKALEENKGDGAIAGSADSKMVLYTVAGMGGVTVVMLIFLIVLFDKNLGRK